MVGIEDFFLHHAFAYGGHLRTAVGIDNCCYDIAAECGANLVQQVGIFFAGLGIFVVADFECGAVSCQTTVEARADTWTEVTTNAGSAHEANLGLNLTEEIDYDCCVRI